MRMVITAHLVNFFADLLGVICDESIQKIRYDYDDPVACRGYKLIEMGGAINFTHRQKRYAILTGVQVVFQI